MDEKPERAEPEYGATVVPNATMLEEKTSVCQLIRTAVASTLSSCGATVMTGPGWPMMSSGNRGDIS